MRLRPFATAALVLTGALLTACSAAPEPAPSRTVLDLEVSGSVGIAMPASEGARYLDAGPAIDSLLSLWGAQVDLRYASDEPTQAAQITSMVDEGVDVLIIAPVGDGSLADPLARAATAGVTVISYDRLIRDTADVDYYVGFDEFGVGTQIAWAALDGLGLSDLEGNAMGVLPEEPYNVEVFAGDIGSGSFYYGYNGTVRQVLELSAEQGAVAFASGQSAPEAVSTTDAETAATRMQELLDTVYVDGVRPDAVATAGDEIALSVIDVLRRSGYSPGSEDWPVVVGSGASLEGVRAVQAGEMFATVLTDDRLLHEAAAYLAASQLLGEQLDLNVRDYDNGARTVPAFLVPGTIVTEDTIDSALIDSGYYTRGQLG